MIAKDKLASAQNRDEVFDVVDQTDSVVGQAFRWEVHERKLLHRAVHVLVFDARDRLFLQKRSLAKDMSPGLWDSSCSGHLDAGEGYDQAACRELNEEIGLRLPEPPSRWFYVEACEETGREFVWVYRTQNDGPFNLNAAEIDEGTWLSSDELKSALLSRPHTFTPPFRFLWTLALTKAGASA